MVFVGISLMISDFEYLFRYLWARPPNWWDCIWDLDKQGCQVIWLFPGLQLSLKAAGLLLRYGQTCFLSDTQVDESASETTGQLTGPLMGLPWTDSGPFTREIDGCGSFWVPAQTPVKCLERHLAMQNCSGTVTECYTSQVTEPFQNLQSGLYPLSQSLRVWVGMTVPGSLSGLNSLQI